MSLFGPPDIGKMEIKGDVNGLIKALSYTKDMKVQIAAIKALEKIGGAQAIEPLNKVFRDSSSPVKQQAFDSISNLGDIAVDSLIEILKTGHEQYRNFAAEKLGMIGDKRAVEPLIDSLFPYTRISAIHALLAIGDKRAIEPLIAVLKNNKSNEIGQSAAMALGRFGDTRAIEPLIVLLEDFKKGDGVAWAAVVALGEIGGKQVTKVLVYMLSEGVNVYIQPIIVKVLEKLGWQPTNDLAGAFSSDTIPYKEDDSSWPEAYEKSAVIYWIIKEKIEKCVEIGAPAIPHLGELAKYSKDRKMQSNAIIGLGKIGGIQAVKPITDAVIYKDFSLAGIASEALKNIGEIAVPLLITEMYGWRGALYDLQDKRKGGVSYMGNVPPDLDAAENSYEKTIRWLNDVLSAITGQSFEKPQDWNDWWESRSKK